ncbi:MAG: TRAP transporter small permease subunit [Alphaproteobacteria bacterium]|nr:TRAP transporter small permease subunit [Alphaproteobacteria bacterium]
MQAFSPQLIAVTKRIDAFSEATGLWVAWLNLPLVGVICWEVGARYVFNSPTAWVFDMTYMLYAAIYMLGSAYALRKGAHIRTDFFFERWSIKTRGLIDTIAYVALFFPSFTLFMVVGWHEAVYAFAIGETSEQTPWRPVLWPLKGVIPLTCVLLMVQGVSETIKSVYAAYTGFELEHKERVEV